LHDVLVCGKRLFNVDLSDLVQMSGLLEFFCSEDRDNGEYFFERYRAHLLVELRRLGEIGLLLEILQGEQFSSSFACRSDYDWRLNLHVTTIDEECSEAGEYSRLYSECGSGFFASEV